jgi:hypothetical protein
MNKKRPDSSQSYGIKLWLQSERLKDWNLNHDGWGEPATGEHALISTPAPTPSLSATTYNGAGRPFPISRSNKRPPLSYCLTFPPESKFGIHKALDLTSGYITGFASYRRIKASANYGTYKLRSAVSPSKARLKRRISFLIRLDLRK